MGFFKGLILALAASAVLWFGLFKIFESEHKIIAKKGYDFSHTPVAFSGN